MTGRRCQWATRGGHVGEAACRIEVAYEVVDFRLDRTYAPAGLLLGLFCEAHAARVARVTTTRYMKPTFERSAALP